MKTLVLNGSPKKERSDTMRLTRAFLEGAGIKQYETVHLVDLNIRPCLGCYSCWHRTPGKCVHDDCVSAILDQITASELVIWSAPLYCYSFPAPMKALIDRLLPLSTPKQYTDEEGKTYHPSRDEHPTRMLLISGCGYPDIKGNYDALIWQFARLFGSCEDRVLCAEAPMLNIDEARPLADPRLELVRKAGLEFAKTGHISAEMRDAIESPMLDPEVYRKMAGGEA